MIALFKQKSPGNIVVLFIFGLLIKLPAFLYPSIIPATPADGWLYHIIYKWFGEQSNLLLAAVIAFLLLYIQSIIVTTIVNEYRMTSRQTFLPGMSFILVSSLIPHWNYLSAPLFASTFILWAFSKLMKLYNVSNANTTIYNIGLLLCLASAFYFPSLVFLICIILGIMILRAFKINEFFLLVLGITTPYYFNVAYLLLADKFDVQALVPDLSINLVPVQTSLWIVGSVVLLLIPFLVGGYYVQTHLRKMLIQARKNWSIILLYLLFATFIPFINNTGYFTTWIIAVAPFAIFHGCTYLYPPAKWIPVAIFFIMLGFILAQQYLTPYWQNSSL